MTQVCPTGTWHFGFLLLLALCGLTQPVYCTTIFDGYAMTVVTEFAMLPPDHWARYDANNTGTVSLATNDDDSNPNDPIDFCLPYFQLENARMYINSNGFLSPAPYVLCGYFCSTAAGTYLFDANSTSSWPEIGLFVTDLYPKGQGTISKNSFSKIIGGTNVSVALVSYANVVLYGERLPTNNVLTAQVELWANGTIVMRYAQVPDFSGSAAPLPSMGLQWSSSQFAVLSTATANGLLLTRAPFSVRYEPTRSPCLALPNCSACINAPSCSWCPGRCVKRSLVADYCPSLDADLCNVTLQDISPQQFYTTSQWLEPFVDLSDYSTNNFMVPISSSSVALNLPFQFPLFYNPSAWNTSSSSIFRRIFVSDPPIVSFSAPAQCFTGLCFYSRAIVGLLSTALATTNGFGITQFRYITLPNRTGSSLAGLNSTWVNTSFAGILCNQTFCPDTAIVDVRNLQPAPPDRVANQVFSMQIVLFANGSIQLRYNLAFSRTGRLNITQMCQTEAVFPPTPTVTAGAVNRNSTDPANELVPWTMLREQQVVHLVPVPGCADCRGRGRCNATTRECMCDLPFHGPTCGECAPGYFGPLCAACAPCHNGGTCDDGTRGSGVCFCQAPYSGRNCNVTCPANSPTQCSSCNYFGGYCQCGTCICSAAQGYSGANCSAWQDPCIQYSLDGCPVCVARNPQCRFCFGMALCVTDFNMLITSPGAVNRTVCPANQVGRGSLQCQPSNVPVRLDQGIAIIIVIIIFGGLGIFACLVVLLICVCRRPYGDPILTHAVIGTPDFQFPRREREIIHMVMLPPQRKGKPVQGIPLKQIALKDLQERQQRAGKIAVTSASTAPARQ